MEQHSAARQHNALTTTLGRGTFPIERLLTKRAQELLPPREGSNIQAPQSENISTGYRDGTTCGSTQGS